MVKNFLLLILLLLFFHIGIFGQNLTNGLVAYFPFTGNAMDASGNNLNGTVHGATLTTDRFGNADRAYYFNAVDSNYISVPHDTLLNISPNITIAFWVYKMSYGGPDSSNAIMSVIHKGRDVINSYGFYTVDFTDRFYVRNLGVDGANTDPVSSITLNNWHFVVGVHDAAQNQTRLYIDGVLKQTRPGINFAATNQYPLLIGRHYRNIDGTGGFGFPFDGKIDDVRLYNRVLTNQEILLLYNEPCTNFTQVPQNPAICKGDNVVLSASGADLYNWQPGGGSLFTSNPDFSVNPLQTTTYTLTAMKLNGCTDVKMVTVQVDTSFNNFEILASKDAICQGDTVFLSVPGGFNYMWSGGALSCNNCTAPFAIPAQTTIYNLTVINPANGCSDTRSKLITVNNKPSVNVTSDRDTICYGESVTLTASGADSYQWIPFSGPGIPGSVYTVALNATTTFTVVGSDANNCEDMASITIVVVICTGIEEKFNSVNFSLYPNPANDHLFLESSVALKDLFLEIIDLNGRVISSIETPMAIGNKFSINIKDLPPGAYFVSLKNEEFRKNFKFIKH